MSLDEAYLAFVETAYPSIHLPALKHFIKPHYQMVVRYRQYFASQLGRDFVSEWHRHLVNRIRTLMQSCAADMVVEGYLFIDCLSQIAAEFRSEAKVFPISVNNRTYEFERQQLLAIEDVASLGLAMGPEFGA